jgi:chromosome partitioning protein
VKRNVRLSEAPSFGKPALLYEASSRGAQNYVALAREVLENNAMEVGTAPLRNGETSDDAPHPPPPPDDQETLTDAIGERSTDSEADSAPSADGLSI